MLACAMPFVWGDCDNPSATPPPPSVVITIDTLTRFQTMDGWEAAAQAGQRNVGFDGWKSSLFDQAVNDLGINRLRVEVYAGAENPSDYFATEVDDESPSARCNHWNTVNDNDDPQVINPAGFHFSQVDSEVVKVVLPMKERLEARGEHLFVNLNYVAFIGQCRPTVYVHIEPAEYAEFILAAFLHLRERFGFVPDAVEIILEPDNGTPWSGTLIAQAIVATAVRLSAEGFHPLFVAPSTTDMGHAVTYADDIYRVSGVQPLLYELAYHRYSGVSDGNLTALSQRAIEHSTHTAMLEHIGSGVEDLYTDLTVGQVSAWQQYALAFPAADNGGHYYSIVNGQPVMGDRSRYLRQYFHYVRAGARRVSAQSNTPLDRPVAFQNANGRVVVVIHVGQADSIEVRGLRPGKYGASETTSSATGTELGDQVVGSNGRLALAVPSAGVLTIYGK
jgi:hypothetical protein